MNKKTLAIGIVTLSLLTALFYWHELRPTSIRKNCTIETVEIIKNNLSSLPKSPEELDKTLGIMQSKGATKIEMQTVADAYKDNLEKRKNSITPVLDSKFEDQYNFFYKRCLQSNGLKN